MGDVVQSNSSQRSSHCSSRHSKCNVDQSNKSARQHSLDKRRVDQRGRGVVERALADHLAGSIVSSDGYVTALVSRDGRLSLVQRAGEEE